MSRRKGAHTIPDPFAPALVSNDKRRGAVVGLAVGEMLGKPVDGLDRDAILRAYGRVVRPIGGPVDRPLRVLARAFTAQVDDVELRARLADVDPADPRRLVIAPLVCAASGGTASGGTDFLAAASSASDFADAMGGDEHVVEASAMLAIVSAIAAATDPFDVLPARALLDAARSVASTSTGAALDQLARLIRTPMRPSSYVAELGGNSPPIEVTLLVLLSLLVRPRALRESVVFAVNLGGACSLRGALTGTIAGSHRGASCVPKSWLAAVYHGSDDAATGT